MAARVCETMAADRQDVERDLQGAVENVLSRYRKRYSSDSDEEEELRPLRKYKYNNY